MVVGVCKIDSENSVIWSTVYIIRMEAICY